MCSAEDVSLHVYMARNGTNQDGGQCARLRLEIGVFFFCLLRICKRLTIHVKTGQDFDVCLGR